MRCLSMLLTAALFLEGYADPSWGQGAQPAATIDAGAYPTLQAAIDALPASGGIVKLPPGVFELSEPLRIHSEDVCLEGSGTSTHLKNVNTQGAPAILVAHPDCKDVKKDNKLKLWRIRLSNFRVTGNEQSGAGIEARLINEIFIDGVTVSYHGGDGILLDYCYEDPRICNSLITYNKKTGLNLQGCHDIVVSATHFEENQDALRCVDGFNLCMTGCCADDHLGNGVIIENTYGSVLSGNMLEECNGTAVILDRDCYGITLSANVIAHNGGGIDLRDAHGCAVSANTFTLMKTQALRIGPESGRITVTGNNFCNSYIGEQKVRRAVDDLAAGGMIVEGARDITVTGNVFSGLTEKAFTLAGETSGIVFANNVLVDVEADEVTNVPGAGSTAK